VHARCIGVCNSDIHGEVTEATRHSTPLEASHCGLATEPISRETSSLVLLHKTAEMTTVCGGAFRMKTCAAHFVSSSTWKCAHVMTELRMGVGI
jgi:hypothetical protein